MSDAFDEPLRLPARPSPPARPPLPIATAIVPVIGAVVLWRLTGSVYALWFAALGPLVAVASVLDGLRTRRRAGRRSAREAAAALVTLGAEVEARHADERERAWRRTPDVAGYAARADEIWRAVPGRSDVVVVGRGVGTSAVRVEGETHDEASRELRRQALRLEEAPITVPLSAGIAVCGPAVTATAVVRALVLQICLAQAPGRVRFAGAGDELARLPHADATRGSLLFVGAGAEPVPDEADIPIIRVEEGSPPPPRCAAVLVLAGGDRARLDHDGVAREVRVEALSAAQAHTVASALADRATTLGQRVDGAVSLEELPPGRGGRASLAAPIGVSGGRPVVVDLVGDGPHAVVIGVTGSGKSELLTTWIAGMCRTRTPQELALLLVDFKGGRTFEALEALPHVTGVLTDLDEARTVRAVESLRAEIRHRERVLAGMAAREIGGSGDALARLVIVVDEYAALVAARPELHDLFADIASRGRALGMHLILASQRAAGAFRDAVMANAPLRIAFRVTDAADSRAALGLDDAARLPGTAATRGTALVQRSADAGPGTVRVARCAPAMIDELRAQWADATPARRPWLPPLPERIDLEALRSLAGAVAEEGIVLGLADEPDRQRQTAVLLPPDCAGIAVVGGPGSGRTSLLRTVAAQCASAVWVPADPEGAWDAVRALASAPRGTVALIDDADALAGRLPAEYGAAWVEMIERLAREARMRGLTLVVSVARVSGGMGRILELLPRRAILPLPRRADHVVAGGESVDFLPDAPAGRGRWGRVLVQFAVTGAGLRSDPTEIPRVVPLLLEPSLAFVVGTAGRAESVRVACAAAGLRTSGVDEVAASPASARDTRADDDRVDVVIGTPEAWLAQWRVLADARERRALVVDAACAAEFRAVTGSRDLPPYALPGAGRAWLITPGARAVRVMLPGGV